MKTTILFFLTILSLVGCSKNDDPIPPDSLAKLPPETQTGANTFGCFINGNLLIPRSGTGTVGATDYAMRLWGGYPTGTEYTEIDIRDYKNTRTASLLLHIQSLDQLGEGNYIIDESNGMSSIDGLNHNYIHCRIFNPATNSYQYYRSFNNSGIIKISNFDFIPYEKKIISGTFTCKMKNSINPADVIEITSGRFDINGYTLLTKVFP